MAEERVVKLRFPALAERLRMVRAVVSSASEMAGCTPEVASKIVIAVNEACMNIIQHAYKGDPSGEIILEILNNDSELIFKLTDFADTVDPGQIKSRELGDLRPGGLGTFFIHEIMDNWVMQPLNEQGGNSLQLTKRIE